MVGISPPEEGGSERVIYELSKRIDCDVLTQKGSSCEKKIEVGIIGKGFIRNILFALRVALKLPFISSKYDIIHIHENTLYWVAFFSDKVVLTIHGLRGFKFHDNKFLWFFFEKAINAAREVIVVSRSDEEMLERKTHYIPNGVDLTYYG